MSFSAGLLRLVALCIVLFSAGLQAQTALFTDLGLGKFPTGINSAGQIVGAAAPGTFFVKLVNGTAITVPSIGGSFVNAVQINDAGQVIGNFETGKTFNSLFHAFVWQNGSGMTDLGTYLDDTQSRAVRINRAGQIVGTSFQSGSTHAVIWQPDQSGVYHISNLGSLGPPLLFNSNDAEAINNAGQVVGTSSTDDPGNPVSRAFIWQEGQGMTDLGNPPGESFQNSGATDINDAGQVIGVFGSRPFVWQADTGMILLEVLPGMTSSPFRINARGQILGFGFDAAGVHGILWEQDETGTYHPTELGFTPVAINNVGQIIGEEQDINGTLFLWQFGERFNLFKLLPPGLVLNNDSSVTAINDAGQIVGIDGNQHAWQLQISGCGQPFFSGPFPNSQNPKTFDFRNASGDGWKATMQVSDRDGLTATDVSLNQRYMAVKMSLPYYTLALTTSPPSNTPNPLRCELTPNDTNSAFCASRLVDFKNLPTDSEKDVVEATYEIDNIDGLPNDSNSCLLLKQRYEFWKTVDPTIAGQADKACEPTEKATCARFKPIVKYQFVPGPTGNKLDAISTAQRLHFAPDLSNTNTASTYPEASTVIHDCNFVQIVQDGLTILNAFPELPSDLQCASVQIIPSTHQIRFATLNFLNQQNPLAQETLGIAVDQGKAGPWDNFHQTSQPFVLQPAFVLGQFDLSSFVTGTDAGKLLQFAVPGCPECVHIHWRWSDLVRGLGAPSSLNSPPQFKNGNPLILNGSNQSVEFAIIKFNNSIAEEHPDDFHSLVNGESLVDQPQVFWYSAVSSQQQDAFFAHGGFFTPTLGTSSGTNVSVEPVDVTTSTTPVTLTFDNIIQPGTTTLVTGSTGPLPPQGLGPGTPAVYYDVTTTAQFSGTVHVCINYAGVAFSSPLAIRLFHFENGAWVDHTVSLDVSNTTICGAVTSLSPFAIFQPADTIPPVTTATISPLPNSNGWNNSDVNIVLSSTDNEQGGSGVKQVTFSASGSQSIPVTSVNGASASFSINAEGITTASFFGVDQAGNIEAAHLLTIKLDETPPTISGSRTPLPNLNGWNNADVTVHFACADGLSGLAPGSPPADSVLSSEGGNQQVTGTCQDLAGNTGSATVNEINIDKTPPVLSGLPTPDCTLWPPDHRLVTVATISGADALSGLASLTISGQSNEPMNPDDPDIVITGAGLQPRTIQLRADRLGSGTGRIYTLKAIATDKAGNVATASSTCLVPHDQRQ